MRKLRTSAAIAGQRAQTARIADLLEQLELRRRIGVLIACYPYAAPRLPDDILACFDQLQRQIRPLPEQQRERGSRTRPGPYIPLPRRPDPREVTDARRPLRRP